MKTPTFDRQGYPTLETFRAIREWPGSDLWGLIHFVRDAWYYDNSWNEVDRTIRVHTGGWSGNEDLISSLQDNFIFWSMCWVSTRRGGHYVFRLPKEFGAKEKE